MCRHNPSVRPHHKLHIRKLCRFQVMGETTSHPMIFPTVCHRSAAACRWKDPYITIPDMLIPAAETYVFDFAIRIRVRPLVYHTLSRLSFSNRNCPVHKTDPVTLKIGRAEHDACYVHHCLAVDQYLQSSVAMASQYDGVVRTKVCAIMFASCSHDVSGSFVVKVQYITLVLIQYRDNTNPL